MDMSSRSEGLGVPTFKEEPSAPTGVLTCNEESSVPTAVPTCIEDPCVPTSIPTCIEDPCVPTCDEEPRVKPPTKKRKFGTVLNKPADSKPDSQAQCPTPEDCTNGCIHEQKKKRKTKKAKKENATEETAENIERIVVPNNPPAILRPEVVPLLEENLPYIIFDLETTGFRYPRHIIQIAAISQTSPFSRFVMPKVPIEEDASNITGLKLVGNELHFKGERVEAVPILKALEDFLAFLGDGPVLLVGHNINTYDCQILFDALLACNKIDELNTRVAGFLDTFCLIKNTHPNLGKKKYSQVSLANYFFNEQYDAHDAREDVKILQRIFDHVKCEHEDQVLNFTFTTESVNALRKYNAAKNEKFKSYKAAISRKAISQGLAKTAAGSGLTFQDIEEAHSLFGKEGIASVFSEVTKSGKPRVTKNKKVIETLSRFIVKASK